MCFGGTNFGVDATLCVLKSIPPWYSLSNNYVGRIFDPPSAVPGSPTPSGTTSEPSSSCPSSPSTAYTEPPQEEFLETTPKLFIDSPTISEPISCPSSLPAAYTKPPPIPWGVVELLGDLKEFQHVDLHFRPSSILPPQKRKPFGCFKAKVREFFGRLRPAHDR